MADSEIETQLREIVLRLEAVAAQGPELSGLELAYERGNVSRDEWEAAQAEFDVNRDRQLAELARIDELRARCPTEVDTYVDTLLACLGRQLEDAGQRLAAEPDAAAQHDLRFRHSLLPTLIAALTAWRDRTPPVHAFEWAWRIVYRTTDECAELLR